MKKTIGLLASSILSVGTAQAAFDQGAAILYAYDTTDDDSYFVDTGATGQDLLNLTQVSITDSGLAAFLANNIHAKWTLIASVNDTTLVAGPPAFGQSFLNSGVISTST